LEFEFGHVLILYVSLVGFGDIEHTLGVADNLPHGANFAFIAFICALPEASRAVPIVPTVAAFAHGTATKRSLGIANDAAQARHQRKNSAGSARGMRSETKNGCRR
jgi:hypothetical protein